MWVCDDLEAGYGIRFRPWGGKVAGGRIPMERTSRVVEWTGLQWSGRSRFGADGIQGKMAG